MLFAIPEFQELNLTQIEYDNGVSVDDDSRPEFSFNTAYDKYESESWKNDFVDLNAFVRNVVNRYWTFYDGEQDCFLCIHQDKNNRSSTLDCGNSDVCKQCIINPNLKNNFEWERKPRGQYTFACEYNCFKNKYICCEECDKKDSCAHVCDSNSNECGLKVV